MTETLTIPIIAGLAIGVAFIVTYAVLFQNNNSDDRTGSINKTNDIAENQATSFSDSYPGINQTGEGLVTIRGQQYYFSTLDSNVDIRKVTLLNNIDFHGVSFSFPDSPQLTPAGICIIPAFQFQDGSYEKTGYFAKNPEGGGSVQCGIFIGTSPNASTTGTVLSHHQHPQGGVTVFDREKVRLLVSIS